MIIKLTPAQLDLLKQREGTFVDRHKPGQRLRELALIDAREGAYGRVIWTINAAGEKVLDRLAAKT